MKKIFIYSLFTTVIASYGADTDPATSFRQATKQFPKFDKVVLGCDYKYGYEFDINTIATLPIAYQELAKPYNFHPIERDLAFFPPIIAHHLFKYDSHQPICFFTYTARDICKDLDASPQTTENITRACLRIVAGHAIDLTDERLAAYNQAQESSNKLALIAYIPNPLREIILSDYDHDNRYKDETKELIGTVFSSANGKEFSFDHHINGHVYTLDHTVRKIITKHNETTDSCKSLSHVSPQTTLTIARNMRWLIIDKKSIIGQTYDRTTELKNFKNLTFMFPQILRASADNITSTPYRTLAFEGYAFENPNYKAALVDTSRLKHWSDGIREPISQILQNRGFKDLDWYDLVQDMIQLFVHKFEESKKTH